ncbi:hypothetical protein K5549_002840 [Capra hircus]|nr:hypothetical protein K5549_002840 [Capra hircus]
MPHCCGIFLPTEDKVCTTVSQDLQLQMTLVGYNPEKYTVTQLIYISTITNSAKYYEQYISYFCKMLRLLNTPGRLRMEFYF